MEWLHCSIREYLKEGRLPSIPEDCFQPENRSIFPATLHPNVAALEQALYSWSRDSCGLSPKEIELIRSNGIAQLACFLWPNAIDNRRALTLVKLMQWFALLDTVVDELSGRDGELKEVERLCKGIIQKVFSACSTGHVEMRPAEEGVDKRRTHRHEREPLIMAVALEWWKEMEGELSPKQKARFAESLAEYVLAQVEVLRLRQQLLVHNKPPSLEEYIRIRRQASSALVCATVVEYELGMELDNSILTNPLLQQLHEAVADHASWVNDIFSFPVEFGRGDLFSILPLIHMHHNINLHIDPPHVMQPAVQVPFQEAYSKAWRMAKARQLECASLAQQLLQHEPGLQMYVDSLCAMTSGNILWSQECPRYFVNQKPPIITARATSCTPPPASASTHTATYSCRRPDSLFLQYRPNSLRTPRPYNAGRFTQFNVPPSRRLWAAPAFSLRSPNSIPLLKTPLLGVTMNI